MSAEWAPSPVLTPKQSEIQSFRRNGNFIGAVLLAMLGAQFLIRTVNTVLVTVGVFDANDPLLGLSNTAYCLLQMLWYVISIPVPALAVGITTRNRLSPFPVKRMPLGDLFALALGGMAFAILANFATSWLMTILAGLGVPIPEFPETVEPIALSLLLNIVSTAVLPALAEEIVFRGYVQSALRPCGTTASVVLSAALFALFHGNILQVPFAFMMGLILGWLFARTGSLLPSVLLHFANNLMSVLMSYLSARYPDLQDGGATLLLFAAAILCGTIGFAVILLRDRHPVLSTGGNGSSRLLTSGRIGASLSSPALIAAILFLLIELVVSMV